MTGDHYHFSVNVGKRRDEGHIDAPIKFQYIARLGKYSDLNERRNRKHVGGGEVLLHVSGGNLPAWAEGDPLKFWQASQEFERANGTQFREFEGSLPRGLTLDQQTKLVEGFILEHFSSHPFSDAIHQKIQSDGLPGEHVHIQISERTLDGIERSPDQFFKRFNQKNPASGGCKKDSMGTKERLMAFRASWAAHCNKALQEAGMDARVDHRSYKDRGIDLQPEQKLGGKKNRKLTTAEKSKILEARQARREHVLAASAAAAMTNKIKEQKIKPTLNYIENNSEQADFAQKPAETNYSHIKIMYSTATPAASQPEALRRQLLEVQARVLELVDKPEPEAANTLAKNLQEIAWQIEREEKQSQSEAESVTSELTLIKALAEGVRVMLNSVLRLFGAKELDPFFPSNKKEGGTTAQQIPVPLPGRSVFEIEEEIESSERACAELRSQLNRAGTRKPRTPQAIAYQLFNEALAIDPTNKKLAAEWEALSDKFEVALDLEKRLKEKKEGSNPATRKLLKLNEKLDAAEKAATKIAWQRQAIEAKQTEHKISLGQEKGPQIMEKSERIAALEAEPEKLKQELRDKINAELKKVETLRREHEVAERRQAEQLEQEFETRQASKNRIGRPT
ncbi:MAG: hypothetical protein EPO06_08690 [Burkholderiaceae bacterium]|nr:MAG: hypothetical protein EPO06_08690 [Burkholderiaceae bacterium]